MVGHSLGGTAVLAAGSQIESLKAVATVGSPSSPDHILHMLENQLDEIASKGEATVKLAGRDLVFKQCFVDDVKNYPLEIENLRKPLMVLYAPFDTTVFVDEASKIFGQAKHPKNFVSLDKSDHLLTHEEDAQYVGSVIGSWARRYVELEPQDRSTEDVQALSRAAKQLRVFTISSKLDLINSSSMNPCLTEAAMKDPRLMNI